MNISEYDVIYDEQVYHGIDLSVEWLEYLIDDGSERVEKPQYLNVVCVDSDGDVTVLYDDAWCFRFVRRVERG